jgi:hypothetical protein
VHALPSHLIAQVELYSSLFEYCVVRGAVLYLLLVSVYRWVRSESRRE